MRDGRSVTSLLAGIALAVGLPTGSVHAEGSPPFRQLSHSLKPFACSVGSSASFVVSSRAELEQLLDRQVRECRRYPDKDEGKARFLAELERQGFDFEREGLVLIQEVFGSGMIRAVLEPAMMGPRHLVAAVWAKRPDGPLTPDLSIQCFALAVSKSAVRRVTIAVDGKERATHELTPGAR